MPQIRYSGADDLEINRFGLRGCIAIRLSTARSACCLLSQGSMASSVYVDCAGANSCIAFRAALVSTAYVDPLQAVAKLLNQQSKSCRVLSKLLELKLL